MRGTLPDRVRLGAFEVDLRGGELRHGERIVYLQDQSLAVLRMLVEFGGGIVTREEIKQKLWPNDTVVDFDHGINATIRKLRQAFEDSADEPRYIGTVARRGYRLLTEVECPDDSAPGLTPKSDAVPVQAVAAASENGSTVRLQPTPGIIGKKVSHYRVLDVIGGGGMGLVYKAEDLKLGRQVALKFLPPELAGDAVALQRFEREARAASSLDHPNICTIHEVEEHEGQPFIVMQLLQGETLRDRLSALSAVEEKLPLDELLEIACQICDGLQAAHSKGIIHRDIKPANIFLTGARQVKILDFGLAMLVEGPDDDVRLEQTGSSSLERRLQASQSADATLTRLGVAMGTAGYMSPEQVRGEKLDARTDVFSFGLVLYEMATGKRAFTGETAAIVYHAILDGTPARPLELNPHLPLVLEAVISKALEKDRGQRYQSAAEMRVDLDSVRPEARLPVLEPRLRRWKWLVVVAALLVAVVIGGGLFWRSRPAIVLTSKDTIIVADLVNSTSDPILDEALYWPLLRAFQQSPYITLLYPSKIYETLGLLHVPGNAKLTPELAQRVCLRTGSRAFITTRIADDGNHYQIDVSATDCRSGRTLARTETSADDRDHMVSMLGVAIHQLRSELGEPADSLQRFNTPLEEDWSASLEALQAFYQAHRVQDDKEPADAIPVFKRATELDPKFALAYLNLGEVSAERAGSNDELVKNVTEAFNLRERLSVRARFLVEGVYFRDVTGELERANQSYAKWIEMFPAETYPHQNFALSLTTLGQHERAAAEWTQAVRLTPSVVNYSRLAGSFIYLNSLNEAASILDEARDRGLDGFDMRGYRYILALLRHDSASMQQQVSSAMAKPETKGWALKQLGDGAMYHGHFRAALGFYSSLRTYSPNSSAQELHIAGYTVLPDVETGNALRARRTAEKALAATPTSGMRSLVALVFARTGAVEQAQNLVKSIDQEAPRATLVQKYEIPTIRAAIELNNDRPVQAIEVLKSALPYELAPWGCFGQDEGTLYPAYLRGIAYLKLGKAREASGEFQKILNHPAIPQYFITVPLSYLQLGRAQVMMGNKAAALKSYQDFMTLWKEADPDIPIYKQATAEYERLL
jgi:serine/threonine protein kinase/DNA-binding winged helix-turn-helix (wHTH) protein/tetratricopeptide (TPR) repeat protein